MVILLSAEHLYFYRLRFLAHFFCGCLCVSVYVYIILYVCVARVTQWPMAENAAKRIKNNDILNKLASH